MATLALLFRPIDSFDIWWHLDSGRWMLENLAYLGTEIRSFSHAGTPWPNFSWLFQILVAATHAVGGDWGLLLLKGLLWLVIFSLIGATNLRAREDLLPLLVAVTVSVAFFHRSIYLRPHILEAVFLLLLVMLLKGRWGRHHLTYALLLLLVWANSHASAVVAATALGIHLLFDDAPRTAIPSLIHRLAAAALLPLCLVLTPNGLGIVEVLLSHGSGDYHLDYITEWQPPAQAWILPMAGVLIAAVMRLQGRLIGYGELFLLGFFAVMAFDSQRFQFELAILAIRPMALALRALSDTLSSQRRYTGQAVMLVLAGSLATQIVALHPLAPARLAGFPVDESRHPVATTRVLLDLAKHWQRPLRVLNHYSFGGYLEWQGKGRLQTFIDGRTPTVFPATDLVTISIAGTNGRYTARVLERIHPDAVLFKRRTEYDDSALKQAGWNLVAFDDSSVLYLRTEAMSALDLTPLTFKPSLLKSSDSDTERAIAIRQLKKLLSYYPDNALALAHLGIFTAKGSNDPAARDAGIGLLRRAWQQTPGEIHIGLYLAEILLGLDTEQAQAEVDGILDDIRRYSPPQTSANTIWTAQLSLMSGYPGSALALLAPDDAQQRLVLDGSADAWVTRGHAYAWLGDLDNAAACLSAARLLTDTVSASHTIDIQHLQQMLNKPLSDGNP